MKNITINSFDISSIFTESATQLSGGYSILDNEGSYHHYD